jgi:hypothetical protein
MIGRGVNQVVLPKSSDNGIEALKSTLNITSNTFNVSNPKNVAKSPTKVVNPFGKGLQMTTSDINSIKAMMKFAAENKQEVTIVIPLRKTVSYRIRHTQ